MARIVKKKNCVDCKHWKGRYDLNKCKLHPNIIPNWADPKCKDFEPIKEAKQ